MSTDQKFNKITDILINTVCSSSIFDGLRLIMQIIIITIPVLVVVLMFQIIIRFVEWLIVKYQLFVRKESRKKLMFRIFLKR